MKSCVSCMGLLNLGIWNLEEREARNKATLHRWGKKNNLALPLEDRTFKNY